MKRNLKPNRINSWSSNAKLSKKIFYTIGLSSILVVPSTLVFTSTLDNQFIQSNSLKDNKRFDDNLSVTIDNPDANSFSNTTRPLMPAQFVERNPLITAETGPIISWGNEIYSLDWFGVQRWKIDISQYVKTSTSNSWKRKWVNWFYDRKQNLLFVISMAIQNQKQDVIIINVGDVTILNQVKIGRNLQYDNNTVEQDKATGLESYSISLLDSGELLSFASAKFTSAITNLKDGQTKVFSGNASWDQLLKNQQDYDSTSGDNDRPVPRFMIPLKENVNLAVMNTLKYNSTIFALVDNNIQPLYKEGKDALSKSKKVIDNGNTKPSYILNNGQYYRLLNGKTIFIIQDRLFVFDPIKINSNSYGYVSYKFPKNITSWSLDTNEDIYFKYEKDTKIYKIKSIKDVSFENSNNSDKDSSLLGINTYYDLSGSSFNEVKDNADLFQIYAIPRYSGSLMLISGALEQKPIIPAPNNDQNKYGIMLAITKNNNDPNSGDSPGLLNTNKAFDNPADFTIDRDILNKKLPSEITKEDLTLLNKGFFTTNVDKDKNGKIKYPPFIKSDINDKTKKFTIEVNLDKIPWFTDKLPDSQIPLTITKHFDTINNIDTRIKWKEVNEDYDFKNTLPTKVNEMDLDRFNPFLIDLTSQKVINIETKEQLYPQKKYSVTSKNDQTGEIEIEVSYKYMPLGVAVLESNALKYSFKKKFNIFKSSDKKVFKWNTNSSVETSTSDISNIPSLKKFTEANVLPSSVNANNPNQLLQFIDLNGLQVTLFQKWLQILQLVTVMEHYS